MAVEWPRNETIISPRERIQQNSLSEKTGPPGQTMDKIDRETISREVQELIGGAIRGTFSRRLVCTD
jgi:hypothetical protein